MKTKQSLSTIFAAVTCLLALPQTQAAASAITAWTAFGVSGYAVDSSTRHNGSDSLRCDLTDSNGVAGALSTVTLNQAAAAPVVVTGWSKAQGVNGSADTEYSLYVDLVYMDGTPLWGSIVSFDAGTHDWQQRRLTIAPPKPIKSMTVYALFRHHTGTVWFNNFEVKDLNSSRLFDGQEITPPSTATSAGGWFVRDLTAGSKSVAPIASSKAVKLSTAVGAGGTVSARLVNQTAAVRCVTLYYIEKYAPKNAAWWDDIRTKRMVDSAAEYGNMTAVSVGASGVMSVYPYGCVGGASGARVLGVAAGIGPRITRIGYNGRYKLYYVAFDIALTPRGDAHGHDRADVGLVRYSVDGRWAFRAATARYYSLYPEAYRRRSPKDGVWMPFTAPVNVQHVEDFHVAYHEGDNSPVTDRAEGIASFRYIEPMTYWMNMDAATERTYDNAIAVLKSHAAGPDGREMRAARAVLSSGSMDGGGRFNMSFQNMPWANGAVWILNPNPSIKHVDGDWTTARINALAEPVPGKKDETDGVYLDSLESWSDTLDYGDRSLAASTLPLTFTPSSLRPVIPTWFSVYEDTRKLSQDLHAHSKLLMANSTPIKYPVFSGLLDVMGIETNWLPDGKWAPDTDATFNLRRTVCYHKPYLLLQNTNFNLFTKDDAEKYFRRCAFYGVFPSFFSADAATNPYWESAALYNRDRPLFQQYVPVISALSKAGWEPITYAWTGTSTVWVERYGTSNFTVLNSADKDAQTTLSVDLSKLGIDPKHAKTVTVTDALTGQKVATVEVRPIVQVPFDIAASDTRVFSIKLN